MQKQKLLKLAKGLKSLTRAQSKHFDLGVFVDTKNTEWNKFTRLPLDCKKLCGTAACALGWAPTFFPRSNLKLDKFFEVVYTNSDGQYYGFKAGCQMFDITYDQSMYLFDPINYPVSNPTSKYVAKRIEEFVETNGDSMEKYYNELSFCSRLGVCVEN